MAEEDVRSNLLELDEAKIVRCKNALKEEYFGKSIVGRAVEGMDFDQESHRGQDFLTLGRWIYIPRAWFTDPSIFPDMVFSDLGRGINIGEEKHVVETILSRDNVRRTDVEVVTANDVKEALLEITAEMQGLAGPRITVFAPVEYFAHVYIDWMRDPGLHVLPGSTTLVFRFPYNSHTPRRNIVVNPIWSSKYVGYKEFIIFEKSSCHWIAKPDLANRLSVDVRESDVSGKMELKALTLFRFEILQAHRIKIISPSKIPSEMISGSNQ